MGNNRNSTKFKEITKAPIAKELIELKRELKGVGNMAIQKEYGIEHVRKIHNSVFSITDVLIDKLKDGFQITDAIGFISIYGPIKDISANWSKAKLEYCDLDNYESSQIVGDVMARAYTLAGGDLDNTGERNIDKLMFVLTKLGDLVDTINEKLSDGMQPEDLNSLPEVTELLIAIIKDINEAALDAKDLKGREYVEIARYLTLRIHGALAA